MKIKDRRPDTWTRQEHGIDTVGANWLRRSDSGLYELYVEGTPYERGVANGLLAKELIAVQEQYFKDQIEKLVPSRGYLRFLKYLVAWFNRKLPKYVAEEFKEEIYGISRSASNQFNYIGKPYHRLLNYHAAHDIGHALQSLALVGCTSFGTWGEKSAEGQLIIGRNFDFYVGENFALNKIVQFEAPTQGLKFMFVTWGGFIGVVSGMNEKGLTVTINAAKSGIPLGSATPVSLVAREILQYAGNIEEAKQIAQKRKMFVSESFLIGSAADGKAVILEKTPKTLEVYDPGEEWIGCANHFQSAGLGRSPRNTTDMAGSASPHRERRLKELLEKNGLNSVEKTVAILRDYSGMQGEDIGLGNERALNQFIGHHSIVFEPGELRVWVSTAPWQDGAFICYDLKKVFALRGKHDNQEIADHDRDIPEDPFVHSGAFSDLLSYKEMKRHENIDPDALVACNPELYQAYVLAGNYCFKRKEYDKAFSFYTQALTKVVATWPEEAQILKQIARCEKKIA